MLQKQFTIFETMQKAFNTELKLKLCKNKLHRSNNVRYLCIKIHENLNWKIHKHDFLSKLNRISPKKYLRIMNFAPFNAHTTPLFKNCTIFDIIDTERCIFVNKLFLFNF